MFGFNVEGRSPLLLVFSIILLAGCSTPSQNSIQNNLPNVADLHVVDCLLPGQLRRLGSSSYLTPRRPIITSAADCRIRGGEYVEYDRADYKTALKVWLPAAELGDAEAQTNVGEIFERGLGGIPNYHAAAIWYQKAVKQGNSRALFNLGTFYEQGFGVEKNKLKALNLYRQAWGMPADDVIFQSAAQAEQEAERRRLTEALSQKSNQIALLQSQMGALEKKATAATKTQTLETEIALLNDWIVQLKQEKLVTQKQVTSLPKAVFREPKESKAQPKLVEKQSPPGNVKYGKYYALIIGNQNYVSLDKLFSPISDAQEVANLLETKYGFSVQTLLDANNIEVMQAFNALNDVLTENDNLLVFYAGHGTRMQSGDYENGYWLPVNADAPPVDTFWVSNEFVTRHLSRIKAKRVLVVADSCYAGLLSSAPDFLFMGDQPKYTEKYMQYKLSKKARLLLSSGGDQPVLDNAGEGHSVFAKAFLDELKTNMSILAGPELFMRIRDNVSSSAGKVGVQQKPEFKVIKGAGHEVGDFFFIPIEKS